METSQTLHNWYSSPFISSGLTAEGSHFRLNGKPMRILSGSFHYFRVVPEYWKDRLIKYKHCGLNAIDVYIPWNLHQPVQDGDLKLSGILDLVQFFNTVQEVDLFVILRPGPYVCAELDFGGLPSWLLKDPGMRVRSNYAPYLKAVKRYFELLVPVIRNFQFRLSGGPIIAVQIENEFASFGNAKDLPDDAEYLTFLRTLFVDQGITELLFVSDGPSMDNRKGSIPGMLMTANFQTNVKENLNLLKSSQPDKPLMVMEYWSGWFDHWYEEHHQRSCNDYAEGLETILDMGSSVNIYMFHGGTNFGFINGANVSSRRDSSRYLHTITSYDYDAPLDESGSPTAKFYATQKLIEKLSGQEGLPCLPKPEMPPIKGRLEIKNIGVSKVMLLEQLLDYTSNFTCDTLQTMEVTHDFGFILYRTTFREGSRLTFTHPVRDRAVILVDGAARVVLDWRNDERPSVNLHVSDDGADHFLDILVENLGRVNFGNAEDLNDQSKGLLGSVKIDGVKPEWWEIYVLDFSNDFLEVLPQLTAWQEPEPNVLYPLQPTLYTFQVNVKEPLDTFLHSDKWTKGVAFVNGFNLGRYWNVGPQQTLYIPAPLLREGGNVITVFELHSVVSTISLLPSPILNKTVQKL